VRFRTLAIHIIRGVVIVATVTSGCSSLPPSKVEHVSASPSSAGGKSPAIFEAENQAVATVPPASSIGNLGAGGMAPDGMEPATSSIPTLAPTGNTSPSKSIDVTAEPVAYEGERNRPVGAVAAAASDEEFQTWNIGGRSDPQYVSNRPSYHPGTRVMVDASPRLGSKFLHSSVGRTFAQRLVAQLRNHGYWPFRICYEDVARERPDRGGKTELRLTIDSNGTVRLARLMKTELKERTIATCHAAAAKRLHIEASRLRRIEVDVTVAVWPGDVPLVALPMARPQTERKGLQSVARLTRGIEREVHDCLVVGRQNDPELWGRLALSFRLDQTSHPAEIGEYLSHFGNAQAVQCVAGHLRALEFDSTVPQDLRMLVAWRLHRRTSETVRQRTGTTGTPLSDALPPTKTVRPESPPTDSPTHQGQTGSESDPATEHEGE